MKDQTHAYLTTHLFDQNNTSDLDITHVTNYSGSSNAHAVSLLPHHDPSVIRQLQQDDRHTRVQLKRTDGGVIIINQFPTHLRVFTSSGMLVFSKKTADSSVFVPLKPGDTYLISTGDEVVKYAY